MLFKTHCIVCIYKNIYFPVKKNPKGNTVTFPIPEMVAVSASEGQRHFRQTTGQEQRPACAVWLKRKN